MRTAWYTGRLTCWSPLLSKTAMAETSQAASNVFKRFLEGPAAPGIGACSWLLCFEFHAVRAPPKPVALAIIIPLWNGLAFWIQAHRVDAILSGSRMWRNVLTVRLTNRDICSSGSMIRAR